ncbi:DUF6502 family protein [Limnohabitans sp.]|uniref:DUF6502 family protein n=1 Tax=Limnohabitans sp. TaxID=1907725 RepID=UPI00286EF110|nr:DUF6502 family protein [Limnohabitans sp.]
MEQTNPSNNTPDSLLPEALAIVEPLIAWLIRSGVGYNEFATALKPVFLAQAQQELLKRNQKPTDSALSLLSGLHRKDVRASREAASRTMAQVQANGSAWGKPSMANQVATRWLSLESATDALPISGDSNSFEALARSVSKDVHPRTVLQELVRLGLAQEDNGYVHLLRDAFVPDASHKEAKELFAGSAADHLQAGVHNLCAPSADDNTPTPRKFLEQSVFAAGLSPESVQQLNLLANTLWAHVLEQVVQAATPLCEKDANYPEPQRFRLGVFSFAAPEFKKTSDNAQP